MPNTSDVRIGAPNQSTTGAILHADVGTTLPTTATESVDSDFAGSEYVSEDGLTLSPSRSTSDIKDWSGAVVRKVLQSFDGTLSWTMISTNEEALKIAFGDDYVTATAATSSHGTQLAAELGAYLPDEQSWVFNMKDGDAKMRIVVPKGQITEVGEVTFKSDQAVGWKVTLATYPDSNGRNIYIYTDDGVTVSA